MPPQSGAATKDHEPLAALVGAWQTSGEVYGPSPGANARFQGSDTYEWGPGGFFVVLRWDVTMPDGPAQGIEIIGLHDAHHTFRVDAYDSHGQTTRMVGQLDDGRWQVAGELLRFTGAFQDHGRTLTGEWESRSDPSAAWRPLMRVVLTKVD